MCAIIGALVWDLTTQESARYSRWLNMVFERSMERGRDGRGWAQLTLPFMSDEGLDRFILRDPTRDTEWKYDEAFFAGAIDTSIVIGNLRAEPTTEHVANKRESDQQPYQLGHWCIVHNGTIANDKDLRTHDLPTSIDSAAIVELLSRDPVNPKDFEAVAKHFNDCIAQLHGSFAILATHDEHPGIMFVACNYRPIWFAQMGRGVFFASARDYLPPGTVPEMVEPYSAWAFSQAGKRCLSHQRATKRKALVVCSGGLDSTVAAAQVKRLGYQVELINFQYGSRAEGPERKAVTEVATALGVPLHFMPIPIYDPADSPLLRADSTIAGGEAGAEFAHEWVPARNLVMLAIATAFAEAKGFDTIVLGNNLEEAGAYPDNEPEFIAKFNDVLPFAVGDGKRVRVIMPVGNLMKHEIVKLGVDIGAPLDKTWSCYRAGHVHCGTCGPCYMRRTAFAINGIPEVIPYANEE